METGIQICGLNGCGKSTLGRVLAEKIGFYFIDNENLYFSNSNTDESYIYMNPKSRQDVEQLLVTEVSKHPNFVFAAVKGDYGNEIIPMYDYVENWLKTMKCPIIRVDGTKPIEENVEYIRHAINI